MALVAFVTLLACGAQATPQHHRQRSADRIELVTDSRGQHSLLVDEPGAGGQERPAGQRAIMRSEAPKAGSSEAGEELDSFIDAGAGSEEARLSRPRRGCRGPGGCRGRGAGSEEAAKKLPKPGAPPKHSKKTTAKKKHSTKPDASTELAIARANVAAKEAHNEAEKTRKAEKDLEKAAKEARKAAAEARSAATNASEAASNASNATEAAASATANATAAAANATNSTNSTNSTNATNATASQEKEEEARSNGMFVGIVLGAMIAGCFGGFAYWYNGQKAQLSEMDASAYMDEHAQYDEAYDPHGAAGEAYDPHAQSAGPASTSVQA